MPDTIGRIAVPTVTNSGQTFPLTTQYPFGFSVERPVIVHRFGSLDAKQEQRYYVGIGPRKFQFTRPNLGWTEARDLRSFWESLQGPWQAFTYNVPNPDGTASSVLVTFEEPPISFNYLRNACQVGLNLVEVADPTQAPTYPVVSTCLRFPSSALSSALLSEVQQVIPLVHIRVRESAVPDIWLSDRRVTFTDAANGGVAALMGWADSSQLYLPRLIGIGESGSDVLISQDIKGSSDNVRFTFGNGDRLMTQLANDTDLKYASIDFCLFHVNSGILIQIWKGVIQNYTSAGTPNFPVTCSDGFFQMMNQYPERQASRQCWKNYNDGRYCPWATKGASAAAVTAAGGDPTSCDYYLESPNGCQVHWMAPYFGGQQCDPQGVIIKDDSTGFMDFARNTVTATSIISDTIWGLALPEIWCNDGGNPLYAFMANALMVAYRDESGYADSLGILGAGPLGGFTPSMVVQNADGYRYVVAPMVDGYTWQGLKVDGNLDITKYQPGMGLRYVVGNDPANPNTDYFSLGQGTPQVWEPNNYAAGIAACEIRIVKSTTIQPSTPDQHQMTVPLDCGLWGWVWDQHGNRTAVMGLINPFWIAVNMLLRAMGLYGDPSTGSTPSGGAGPASVAQLATFVLSSLITGTGAGCAEIAADQVVPVLGGSSGPSYTVTTAGQALGTNAQVNDNPDGSYAFQYTDSNGNLNVLDINSALALGYVTQTTGAITETQFQFQGVISSQKPFRDWIAEVLNCCLGFYTWEFGQLKLGCRNNASAVDAYTLANILLQSLKLTPTQTTFEHLVISYADVAYQFQANTAEYCDKSHAAYYGRAGSPLTSQMHSVGISTLSQALRIAATRTREEVGGVTQTEWRNARNASWQTTLLGLANAVGQVVSMTHPDIPGARGTCNVMGDVATWVSGDLWTYAGTANGDTELIGKVILIGGLQVTITAVASDGSAVTTNPAPPSGTGLSFYVITMCFRIEQWSLKKDWSVQIDGKTVTASMYDLDVGPKPTDVVPAPLPALFTPIPWGPAWAPYQVQAAANDALFAGEWTFESNQEFNPLSDGSQQAVLLITGKLPVTQFSATGAGAPGIGSVARAVTGGSLPANSTLWATVCAVDGNGLPSSPANIAVIGTASTGTGAFTLAGITWPKVTGLVSFVLFVGTQDDLICEQATGALTPTGDGTAYTPNSVSFDGPVARSTWALPSPYVSRVRIKAKLLVHSGVAGIAVDSVSTNTVVAGELIDPGGAFNPAGRVISAVGRANGITPFASFKITAFNQTIGAMTLDRDPTGILLPGDAIVIRNVGTSLTATPTMVTSVTDSGYQNGTNKYGGMTPGAEVGNLIRIVKGTGRNQPPSTITGNTATQLTFQPPLLMDNTSVWIVEGPTWAYQGDSSAAGNACPTVPTTLSVPTDNFTLQPMLIAGFTVDVNGVESPDNGDAPIREDWIYGTLGTVVVSQSMTQLPSHCTVQFDTSGIQGTTTTLSAAVVAGALSLTLAAPYAPPNNTYLTVDNESFLVTGGSGTLNLTVVPGQLGTTQSSHAAGATVHMPGCLTYTLLPPSAVPNQNFYGHKNTPDINYVLVVSPSGMAWMLADTTPAMGTVFLKAPGA